MNLFVETYWISIIAALLATSSFTAIMIGTSLWSWWTGQLQLPTKPFMCPVCLGFWFNFSFLLGVAYETQLTFWWSFGLALIGGVITELIDQKINFKYE